jgi:predicted ATPase
VNNRPLVGRARELAAAAEALDAAASARTSLLLFSGDPGIGKSRLVEEAAALARQRGFAVCWGRAWESGGAPPFWPWTQLLRALLKEGAAAPPEIARLLPELPGAAALREAGNDDRFLLFDAVLRFVTGTAERTPLLLLLEDLHAADLASLQLLEFIAAHLRGARVALVGTWRELEVKLSPPTAARLDRVSREGVWLRVAPLQLAEVAQLSGADEKAARALMDATGGNPLFVTEMLHAAPQEQGHAPLPDSVRAAIRRHLAALPPALAEPLELAAVIGRELSAQLLAALLGRPLGEVVELLDQAVELGVLVGRGPGRWAFAHSLICDTLHLDLPARRRTQLHLKVADALESTAAGDPAPPLAELARHLFEAGPDVIGRAADAASRAAERALKALAFEQAEELVQRALDGLQAAPLGSRFELWLTLGRARMAAGGDDEGRAACLAAAELVRENGSSEQLARAALGYGFAFTFGATDPKLVELLEQALARLGPEDSPLRARCLGRLAAARQPSGTPHSAYASRAKRSPWPSASTTRAPGWRCSTSPAPAWRASPRSPSGRRSTPSASSWPPASTSPSWRCAPGFVSSSI